MRSDSAPERSSALRRALSLLDPASPGFVERLARLGAALTILGACALVTAAVLVLRTPFGRYLQGVVLFQFDQYDRVISVSRSLVDAYPDSNFAYYKLLAATYRRSGQIDAQLATYDEAVAALPDDWAAHSYRCWYGTLYGHAATVIDSCDRSVQLVPAENGLAHCRRGVARAMLGDREGAIADLEEGLARWRRYRGGSLELRQEWESWLETLRAGGDPFDEATLEQERRRF